MSELRLMWPDFDEENTGLEVLFPLAVALLSRFPLIQFGAEYVAPVQHYLLTHAYDGIYYKLLREHGDEVSSKMGLSYQAYARRLFAWLKERDSGIDTCPERTIFEGYAGRIPDIVIRGEDAVILVEVKSSRLPLPFRFEGRMERLGTLGEQIKGGVGQLTEFSEYLRSSKGVEQPIHLILVLWENLWFWFTHHNWEVLRKTSLPVDVRTRHRTLENTDLIITGLQGLEILAALREARVEGDPVSDTQYLEEYERYLSGTWRTRRGTNCPATGNIPSEFDKFLTEVYLRGHPGYSLDRPRFLRDINEEFVQHYFSEIEAYLEEHKPAEGD